MATMTHEDEKVAPELVDLKLADKPDGPGAAAMVAAGAGTFVLGLMTTLNEMSEGVNEFLAAFSGETGVGPLAGKTTVAAIAFFLVWAVLGLVWKGKDVDLKKAFWVGIALGALGALFTFPPFFEMFAE
jgi:hypothetical protein